MTSTIDAARTRLLIPGRCESSDFAPRCGSTLQVVVSDLVGERRCHIFPASATLESFKARIALSRGVDASCLVVVLRGVIIEEDQRGSQTLVSSGMRDGSTVHVFAREPIARPAAGPQRATPGNSVAEPPRCAPTPKHEAQASTSWRSRWCLQCQSLPRAAPSFKTPRPISRLGRIDDAQTHRSPFFRSRCIRSAWQLSGAPGVAVGNGVGWVAGGSAG